MAPGSKNPDNAAPSTTFRYTKNPKSLAGLAGTEASHCTREFGDAHHLCYDTVGQTGCRGGSSLHANGGIRCGHLPGNVKRKRRADSPDADFASFFKNGRVAQLRAARPNRDEVQRTRARGCRCQI
jgi:hypothetical protein